MTLFYWLLGILRDERGQVGETQDGGTTGGEQGGEGETSEEPGSTETVTTPEPGTTEGGEAAKTGAQQQVESFIDPKDLPAEIKPHWSRMHRAYTKFLTGKKELEEKAQLVDRFYSDTNFRRETLRQWAMQDGMAFPQAQGQNGQAATVSGDVPAQYVEMAKASLPPELQWMAESQAKLSYAIGKAMVSDALKPYEEKTQQTTKAQRAEQYDTLAAQLSETIPGWEEYEDDMGELHSFLQSDQMQHKRFGSKLKLLYDVVTKNAAATQTATKRLAAAGKNRTTSGQQVRTIDNSDDRIRKAKTNDDAWALAMQKAEDELRKNGKQIPT